MTSFFPFLFTIALVVGQSPLEELYESTNGNEWTNSEGWNVGSPCVSGTSSWFGITCNEDDAVISIELSDNNLVGSLPSTIFSQLSAINTINLDDNQVISPGVFPPGVAPITLATLSLSNNLVDGPLPAIICTLISFGALQTLRLSGNSITGSLNLGQACLGDLLVLELAHNQLTGPIPNGIGNNDDMQILHLNDNMLDGVIPDSLDNDMEFPDINLQNNAFWCPLPDFNSIEHISTECVCPSVCEVDDHGVCNEDNICICNECRSGITCKDTECPQDPFGNDCYSTLARGVCSADGCECECVDPYFGDFCGLVGCPNDCSNPQPGEEGEEHGICNTEFGFCDCVGNWTGPSELDDCSELACPKMCSDRGACNRDTHQCWCDEGFFFDDCSLFELESEVDEDVALWAQVVVFGGIGFFIIILAVIIWLYKGKMAQDYAPPEYRTPGNTDIDFVRQN